jgi:hypothetical protein
LRYTLRTSNGDGRQLEIPPSAIHKHERCGSAVIEVAAVERTPIEVGHEEVLRFEAGADGTVSVRRSRRGTAPAATGDRGGIRPPRSQ